MSARARLALAVLAVGALLASTALADPRNRAVPGPPSDVAAPPAGATRTASGLAYVRLAGAGRGPRPNATSRVRVHYTGWQTDGTRFDSSHHRGRPAEFQLDRLIDGFSEAVQQMAVGDSLRVWIPEDLAYRGRPGAPSGMLVFQIDLLEIL